MTSLGVPLGFPLGSAFRAPALPSQFLKDWHWRGSLRAVEKKTRFTTGLRARGVVIIWARSRSNLLVRAFSKSPSRSGPLHLIHSRYILRVSSSKKKKSQMGALRGVGVMAGSPRIPEEASSPPCYQISLSQIKYIFESKRGLDNWVFGN